MQALAVPSAPTNLVAGPASTTQIDLSWTASSSGDPTKYRVFQSLTPLDDGFIQVDSVNSPDTTYADAGLTTNTTYYYRVYAVNAEGMSAASNTAVTTTFTGTVTDIDGNIYHTITIGTQVWMAENLKTTKYRDGTSIPNITDNATWAALTTGAYCNYNNDPGNAPTYGSLYNWYAVNDVRNIAPTNWHVATDEEWTTLTTYLGGNSVAGGKLKEAGLAHWESPNTSADNSTGFHAVPTGFRNVSGSNAPFLNIGSYGHLWSSTVSDTVLERSWYRSMYSNSGAIDGAQGDYVIGLGIRLIKDNDLTISRTLDSLALVDLYDSTGGATWTNNTNWKSTNPIDTWYGITVAGGRVTGIALNNNLVGIIPSSIGNLNELTSLEINQNSLSGSIPPQIGNLTQLQYLALQNNQLTGPIPSQIGNLSQLINLYLNANQLSGTIPSEIGNLTVLDQLHLDHNQLSGEVPDLPNLSVVRGILLTDNRLTGIPDLSSLSNLEHLWVFNNKLTFEDIEPNIGGPNNLFDYSPQDSVGSYKDTSLSLNVNYNLSVSVGGTANQYQWYKNGNPVGTNSPTYAIPAAAFVDSGTYHCEITNSIATGLTLYSRTIKLHILPNRSLHVSSTGNNSNDGSAQFPLADIGDAMNKAVAGDTIKIGAGTWTENRTMSKQLTLRGGYAPGFIESQRNIHTYQTVWKAVTSPQVTDNQSCTFDGIVFDGSLGTAKAVNVTGGTSTITHCTIVNYFGSGNQGIVVNSAAGAVIKNNTIYNNQLAGGGVIFYSIVVNASANAGTTKIENNIIMLNASG